MADYQNPIATDHPLTQAEQRALRALAGIMIPASGEFGVPGADDATIFADILATALPSAQTVSAAVRGLDELANGRFCDLAASEQRVVAERFRSTGSPSVGTLVALVVSCYYRDDRVMRSLGMDPRPPFPRGFELAEGDWSLLDPVRRRPKLYRDAP